MVKDCIFERITFFWHFILLIVGKNLQPSYSDVSHNLEYMLNIEEEKTRRNILWCEDTQSVYQCTLGEIMKHFYRVGEILLLDHSPNRHM